MRLQYLGTGASEGWPALFCSCEYCRKARALGGKNIRTRSQSIVDGKLLIDFPADTYLHVLRFGFDLPKIRDVLITHSHSDHFYPNDLLAKAPPFAQDDPAERPVRVYGSKTVVSRLKKDMERLGTDRIGDYLQPVEVRPFEPFQAGGYTVTGLLADHIPGEDCLLYLIEKDGSRLFYAHDTGFFPQKTWDYLAGRRCSAVSLDCTAQVIPCSRGHMGIACDVSVREKMLACGAADGHTVFTLNHFSHNGGKLHEEFSELAAKDGFLVSYDGMTVDF